MSEENKGKKNLDDAANKKAEETKKEAKEVKETTSEKVKDLEETDTAHQEAEVVAEEEGLWDSIKEITVKQALLILGGFFLVMLLLQVLDSKPGKSSGKILGNITDKASGALSGVAGAVKDGASGIVEGTKNAVEGATDVVKDGASAVAEGTKNVVESTSEIVKDRAAAVAETTSEVVEDTKEALIVKGENAKGVSGSWSENAKRNKIRGNQTPIQAKKEASAALKRTKMNSSEVAKETNAGAEPEVASEETATTEDAQDISSMAQSSTQLAKDIEAKKAVIAELQAEVSEMESKIDGLKGFIGSADSETTRTIKEQIILWKGLLGEKERDLKEAEEDL